MPILLWGILSLAAGLVALRVAAWQMLPPDLRRTPLALWVIGVAPGPWRR